MQDETDIMGVHTPFPDFGLLPPMRVRAKAEYLSYYYPTHLIVIADMNKGAMSVTNDIENVLYDINAMFLTCGMKDFMRECVVIYRDSEGTWDQVLISIDGVFAGFESIHKTLLGDAVFTVCGNTYDDYKDSFREFDEYYKGK